MKYYSLHGKAPKTSFKEAVIRGIAPDKGLYFPEQIEPLPEAVFKNIQEYSKEAIAFEMIRQFIGDEIPASVLKEIIRDTVSFDFPLVSVSESISVLELFHGPTMAFKDVGARFMARCLGYFSETSQEKKEITVLVATSGDTGGAVAHGFLNVEGVKVVILYPSGKVSDIQEKQLTTLGKNITALEVEGSFDDCQTMVKKAFLDESITKTRSLTSANSINVARWLPQSIYFAYAFQQRNNPLKPLVFSVPSGNFGNICAGMVAQRLGMPVKQFIASVNSNDVIPSFMENGTYAPKPSVATISNAMDVGDPSNFIRIQKLFNNDFKALSEVLTSYSFSDRETEAAIQELYQHHTYTADPHGAVGYLGLQKYLKDHPEAEGIFLETAHPIKFMEVVEKVIGKPLEVPQHIRELIHKKKKAQYVKNYEEFKMYLLQT